jgi:hypothetical protein
MIAAVALAGTPPRPAIWTSHTLTAGRCPVLRNRPTKVGWLRESANRAGAREVNTDRSSDESQASPIPSPSMSPWPGLATIGQLSAASGAPSQSKSGWITSIGTAGCGVGLELSVPMLVLEPSCP